MPANWLDVVLSRRYSVTAMGDPLPSAPGGLPKRGPKAGDGGGTKGGADSAPDSGPFLILPNYPALINIPLVYALCAGLRPLVLVTESQSKALRLFCDADSVVLPENLGAESAVPESAGPESAGPENPDSENSAPTRPTSAPTSAQTSVLTTALTQAADALAAGRSVLLWPSSQLQDHQDHGVPEHNSAFALLSLLQERGQKLPELFLVRSEGLWGSHFSRYRSADSIPTFWASLCARLPALLLGPFLKRRPVRLISRRHSLRPRHLNPQAFQTMLNTWFDAGHEGAVLVGHLPLSRIRRVPLQQAPVALATPPASTAQSAAPTDSALPPAPTAPTSLTALPDNPAPHLPTSTAVPKKTSPQDALQPMDTRPPNALHADLEVDLEVDPESTLPPPPRALATPQAETTPSAVTNPSAKASPSAEASPDAETKSPKPIIDAPIADIAPAVPRTPPLLPVQHALTRQGSVTDASYGQHFSRRSLLGLAKAIGTLIGPVPATRIGISLPCGVGAMAAYIAVLDCTLENDRTPVLLDPDLSPEQLAHCTTVTGITHVISSRKLQGRGLPPDTSPIYLDDITSSQIMRGTALSFMGFAGTTEMDAPAAIFCQAPPLSSADSTPVPLLISHQELMTHLHACIAQLHAPPLNVHSLSILGCLPQHNPLGLLVNTILPLTCGVPIVTVYDAQNGLALARSAENYSVNCFTGNSLSLKNLFHHARSRLAFRYIMLPKDEPCPDELLSLIPKACPHAQVFFM